MIYIFDIAENSKNKYLSFFLMGWYRDFKELNIVKIVQINSLKFIVI